MKKILLTAALVLPSLAFANTQTINVTSLSTHFGETHIAGSNLTPFEDKFTFNLSGISSAITNATLITISSVDSPEQNIDFSLVTLNDFYPLTVSNTVANGLSTSTAQTVGNLNLTGPLTLVVKGTTGMNASYSGTLNIKVASGTNGDPIPVGSVPEPETYAMLLAGLSLVGFSARRKMLKSNK